MSARPEVILQNKSHRHSAFTKTSSILIWQFKTETFQFKYIDDVIPTKPEVPFYTTTVKNKKWFDQELTELWMDIPNDKERICFA